MKKLIELANQYRKEMEMSLDWHTTWGEIFVGDYGSALSETVLVSRNYWFIKRLVENDKIDIDKLEKKVLKENLIRKFDEWLLMLLAIQDEPIRFLCEIIK